MSCPECATYAQCIKQNDWCEDLAWQSCAGAFDCVGRRRTADPAQPGPDVAKLIKSLKALNLSVLSDDDLCALDAVAVPFSRSVEKECGRRVNLSISELLGKKD